MCRRDHSCWSHMYCEWLNSRDGPSWCHRQMTTQKEVRQFIGVVGVCRNFIKDFAKIAAPLYHLLKKGIPFTWGPEQDKAIVDLKEALSNSVPLGKY
jgi:hypothetical protein